VKPLSDIVIPRTKDLPLSGGRTITIREELNHGEANAMRARMYRERADGRTVINPLQISDAVIVAFLVDWNLTDAAGRRLEIRGLGPDDLQAVLNNLRDPLVAEIKEAIEAHADQQRAADDELKKTASIGEPSLAISR
jgi:hypothetical protein